ncbi:MAG: hypothetical protein J0M29_07665 [Chitinophagales bacterium]|nr:hypothetical protein [Chitinophagales bacterium]
MIRIDKKNIKTPAILDSEHPENKSSAARKELEGLFDSGEVEFEFISKIYGHKSVKAALIEAQHGKCCFCESKITAISFGDVEHYRPKAALQLDDRLKLQYPGYYWLAYDFDNLFYCCQICNQTFKRNYFPLEDEEFRVKTHHLTHKLGEEKPLIVNPGPDEPEVHIFFNREIPVAIDEKGKQTIKRTGLDRSSLNKRRLNYLEMLDMLAQYARNGDKRAQALIKEASNPESEYSLMVRCNFPDLLD